MSLVQCERRITFQTKQKNLREKFWVFTTEQSVLLASVSSGHQRNCSSTSVSVGVDAQLYWLLIGQGKESDPVCPDYWTVNRCNYTLILIVLLSLLQHGVVMNCWPTQTHTYTDINTHTNTHTQHEYLCSALSLPSCWGPDHAPTHDYASSQSLSPPAGEVGVNQTRTKISKYQNIWSVLLSKNVLNRPKYFHFSKSIFGF